jgi:hypothetical protein
MTETVSLLVINVSKHSGYQQALQQCRAPDQLPSNTAWEKLTHQSVDFILVEQDFDGDSEPSRR